jgi:hypothetical protein
MDDVDPLQTEPRQVVRVLEVEVRGGPIEPPDDLARERRLPHLPRPENADDWMAARLP